MFIGCVLIDINKYVQLSVLDQWRPIIYRLPILLSITVDNDELYKATNEMRSEDVIQCWMNIAHQIIDQLKGQSASSSLNRSRSTPIPSQ